MKNNRHGQSIPVTKKLYQKIRSELATERDKLILDIAFFTGERWGAIIRLSKSDCYICDSRQKWIPREVITFQSRSRKDRKTRQVPVVEDLRLRLACYPLPEGDLMFPSPVKEQFPITFQAATLAFHKAIEKAGMADLGISTHGTRHNFITSLHDAGFSVAYIQSITGHASISSVSRYIHVDPRGHKDAISAALG